MKNLRECAEEYDRITEEYDRTVCTGPIVRGRIVPVGEEGRICARHAEHVLDLLTKEVVAQGWNRSQLLTEIQKIRMNKRGGL